MEKLSNTSDKGVLTEFQQFLLSKNLVPEKNAPFYAFWVGKFLTYAHQRHLSTSEYHEATIREFFEVLVGKRRDEKVKCLILQPG